MGREEVWECEGAKLLGFGLGLVLFVVSQGYSSGDEKINHRERKSEV